MCMSRACMCRECVVIPLVDGGSSMKLQAKPLHAVLARRDSRNWHTSFGHSLHTRMTSNDEQVSAEHHIPSVACTARGARLLISRDGRSFASTRATIYAQHSCTNVTHATPWTGNKTVFNHISHFRITVYTSHLTLHASQFTSLSSTRAVSGASWRRSEQDR